MSDLDEAKVELCPLLILRVLAIILGFSYTARGTASREAYSQNWASGQQASSVNRILLKCVPEQLHA